jgi:uncharacterized damage-inducible protein DinB
MSSLLSETIIRAVQTSAHLFLKDFDATADSFFRSKCGCGGSVFDQVVEVIEFNHNVAKSILKEQTHISSDQERAELVDELDTRHKARAAFEESIQAVVQAASRFTDEEWGESITTQWGTLAKRADFVLWVAYHNFYHDGQINYIQVLNGDAVVHWG